MKVFITTEGQKRLDSKLEQLGLRLQEVRAEKAVAYWGSGDGWHDNPGFNQLEQLEFRVANELSELQKKVSNAILWDVTKNMPGKVQIGSKVQVEQLAPNCSKPVSQSWIIVGFGETDISKRKVSYDSPIGQAMLDLQIGETGQYQIPAGKGKNKILNIE